MPSTQRCGGIRAIGSAPVQFFFPSEPLHCCYTNPQEYWIAYLSWVKILSRGRECLLKQWGGREINVYHIKIKGVIGEFAISLKHFKVMTKADNIFKEEQMPQIAEAVSPTPAA